MTFTLVGLGIWSFSYAMITVSPTLEAKHFWLKLENIGIIIVPVLWFFFTMEFTRLDKWLTGKPIKWLFWIIPAISLSIIFSEHWFHLYYTSTHVAMESGGPLIISRGPCLLYTSLLLGMVGKYMFDPAMQAYFGDRIPYEQRGTALAVTEMAWSMAFIAGVPAVGFLINSFGWSAPFPIFAVLGLLIFFIIWRIVPGEDPHHELTTNSRDGYRAIFTSIPAIAGISIALWASAANEMVNIIFGVWLEDSFGLKIIALAGASAVIGISELSGEGLVALTTDKLGKPLALTIGLVGNTLASILLPFIGQTQTGALIGLFLFYICLLYTSWMC